ncbi:chemotaxis protein CheD [Azotosporobacter soli]|uniref:chemotaxis protein CheD n=1 Tax=Azotosporobacter soli TaxID=3055040 RepID=UPI0031FE534F
MSMLIVGVGELKCSNREEDSLRTFALGSCVGVIAFAPKIKAAALLHLALPESKINRELARREPARFADTGVPLLLELMAQYGCRPCDMIIKLAGGATIKDQESFFAIGKRNILAVRETLQYYRLGAAAEDVGADYSRTVTVRVSDGAVLLSSPGRGEWLL